MRTNLNDVLSETNVQMKNILLWNGYERIEMNVFLRGHKLLRYNRSTFKLTWQI